MKKLLLLILGAVLITAFTDAQQVQRNKVIVEVGTGTWCPYCPGAAMGVDELIENGYEVAVIENHNGDDYTNVYSNSRNSYYGITGYPTATFDGGSAVVGGSNTESMYSYYVPKVNARMNILSSFTIEATGTHTCLSDFTAHITVNKVATNTSTNLKLHVVVTQSEIMEAWQGQDHLNFVNRVMAPNQNGTAVSFASGNIQLYDITFTVDPSWVLEDCEVVIFLQDNTTKEVQQAMKMPLMDFAPEYSLDAAALELIDIPVNSCTGNVEPSVMIRNLGSSALNSLDIFYQVNSGALQNYTWNGSLDYLASEIVNLPPISFEGDTLNEILLYTSAPNGGTDECPANDAQTVAFPDAMYTPNTVKLIMRTDNNPGETTWELKNAAGEVLDSGGPYTTGGQMIQKTWNLTEDDCHTFYIHDSGGDGLMNPGFYMLYYGSNTTIRQGGVFGYSEIVDFDTSDPVGIEEPSAETSVTVYPNPVQDQATITLKLENPCDVSIKVYAITGQVVADLKSGNLSKGEHNISLDASGWDQGLYLYQVMAGEKTFTGKITVR